MTKSRVKTSVRSPMLAGQMAAFPEDLVLENHIARYYYRMKLKGTATVKMERETSPGAPTFIWVSQSGLGDAHALCAMSVAAKRLDEAPEAKVIVGIDGEKVVDGLPLGNASRFSIEYVPNEKYSLFRALTMEKKGIGIFLPNGSLVRTFIEGAGDGFEAEITAETAIYAAIGGAWENFPGAGTHDSTQR